MTVDIEADRAIIATATPGPWSYEEPCLSG